MDVYLYNTSFVFFKLQPTVMRLHVLLNSETVRNLFLHQTMGRLLTMGRLNQPLVAIQTLAIF